MAFFLENVLLLQGVGEEICPLDLFWSKLEQLAHQHLSQITLGVALF